MTEELRLDTLLWRGFAEQELGDSSQRLATGWAVNARGKMENACDLSRRKTCQCRVRADTFLLV